MSMNRYDESDDITLLIVRFPPLPETMKDENGDWKVETIEKKEGEGEKDKTTLAEQKEGGEGGEEGKEESYRGKGEGKE